MKHYTRGELVAASVSKLNAISAEIRREILSTVARRGGHLSSNLGTVELTVALHRVFDFPRDKIVFDVGHQCYTHKLLSDRTGRFSTLRCEGGISGFPKREESAYDCYDTGHAGTAISAALGIAKARDLSGGDYEVVALVGDGSFNNGLIYEALCSLRILNTRILIVLNDNGMSISPTVGGMHEELEALKAGVADAALFSRFGLKYIGVCNGNDFGELLPALGAAKEALKSQCVLLHVVTRKGQGFSFSENAPLETHGYHATAPRVRAYGEALGEELETLAAQYPVVAVTAAMTDHLGLRGFFEKFPERAFDVGICEEHASVLAASLAAAGMKPYYAIYSTFLQRSFDEIVHDICGQDLPVTLCIDHAGVTGEDGETHQGVFDLSFLSLIPNLTIAVPRNIAELRAMLRMSATYPKPLAIRYPAYGSEGTCGDVTVGTFEVLSRGDAPFAVLAAGERCVSLGERLRARAAAEGRSFTLVSARYIKPLDTACLEHLRVNTLVTLEDNVLIGGLGDAVARAQRGKRVLSFGYRDCFIPHGKAETLAAEYGLGEEEIFAALKELYARG